MSRVDRDMYRLLTEDSEQSADLNHRLFGDNEWSAVDRAEYLKELENRIEADSYQGGA